MEFFKLIYLGLIKKQQKKKEKASFPISLECFFFPLGQFCSSKLCSYTVKATSKLGHGHAENAERMR